MKKYILATFCYNERGKIDKVIKQFTDYSLYDVLIMDDGSTDKYEDDLNDPTLRYKILKNESNMGPGYSVRRVLDYVRKEGYEIAILIAGNNKDSAEDINKFAKAIEEGYDFIQGSRYMKGGGFGKMPFYRQIATRYIHPILFSLIVKQRLTDTTNGFRAIKLSILDDSRIDLNQDWLNQYELEPYLLYKAIKCGYRFKEVPVTKIYPPKELGYTKMKPITGWWSILRPLIYLGLGIKK